MMAFTHDYLQQEEMTLSFKKSDAGFNPLMVNISDFETQVEFTRRLFDFFSPENDDEDTLIVQCDLRECGVKHIMHVKVLFLACSCEFSQNFWPARVSEKSMI